jgi:REP element-mobilizing transposase RayT
MTQENLGFGCCYHLYHAGNPREAIFRLEEDYYSFLELFRKYVWPIANLYAYCLLPTHFHLLLRIKDKKEIEYVYSNNGMLSVQFSNLFGSYTKHINQRYQRTGVLFNGSAREIPRNKDLICDLVVYIHQNPQLYGLVTDFRYWPFSSCFAYLRQDRRSMIAKELLLDPVCHQRIIKMQNTPRMRVRDWEEDAGY